MGSISIAAYIPVLNQRHLDWLERHKGADIFLISQKMAEELVPRLARNIVAVPTETMLMMLDAIFPYRRLAIFSPDWEHPDLESQHGTWKDWLLPDEDVSHTLAEKYLPSESFRVSYEMIWARYDMTAVHSMQPVLADLEVSENTLHQTLMKNLSAEAQKSSDWWRQIAALALTNDGRMVSACNTHLPTEYETYIFGDPRINVDAGQPGKYCAIHAEEAVIALCAKLGIALEGAAMLVTTFPCEGCARQIKFAGVKKVYFRDGYSALTAQEIFRSTAESEQIKLIRVVP